MKSGQFSKQNKKHEMFHLNRVKKMLLPSLYYSDSIWKCPPCSAGTHKFFQLPKIAFFLVNKLFIQTFCSISIAGSAKSWDATPPTHCWCRNKCWLHSSQEMYGKYLWFVFPSEIKGNFLQVSEEYQRVKEFPKMFREPPGQWPEEVIKQACNKIH